jgi:CheY-like chemotaxis protein
MSKRILVVEDQEDNRQIIRDMFSPRQLLAKIRQHLS